MRQQSQLERFGQDEQTIDARVIRQRIYTMPSAADVQGALGRQAVQQEM